MQTAKQLSVTLTNKPGRLATLLTALTKEKVTYRALSVMDSGERGTVRFVPDNVAAATKVLDTTQCPLGGGRRPAGRGSQPSGGLWKNLRATGC